MFLNDESVVCFRGRDVDSATVTIRNYIKIEKCKKSGAEFVRVSKLVKNSKLKVK